MSSKDGLEVVEDVNDNMSPVRQEKREGQEGHELEKITTVDTLHNDEATRVLASYDGEKAWTNEEERKVLKKIDRKLLWLLILTYGLQYYDKAMLSQAVSFI